MARVRGRDLIDAVGFVRASYGQAAADSVVSQLDGSAQACFNGSLREVEWYPLEALVAFLRTAQAALAPGDPAFFEHQGRFAAARQKEAFLGVMVATAESRMLTAPTVWHMFYDVGRLVVAGDDPAMAVGRVLDFPTTPELCARFRGIWEGLATTPGRRARAAETRCVSRGDPYCEFAVAYEPERDETP